MKEKTIKQIIEKHIEDDNLRFAKQEIDHERFDQKLDDIKGFMESLSWLSDISKGTLLLRTSSKWILAVIIGLVALFGGIKSLIALFASWLTPHQ